MEGRADAMRPDELEETAKSLAVRKDKMPAAVAIDCYRTAMAMRDEPDADKWALKDVKNLLQLGGSPTALSLLVYFSAC